MQVYKTALFQYMVVHIQPYQSNRTGATSGAGTAYLSGAPEFTPDFQWSNSFMCNILQIVVCPFVLFLLPIVLSVLQFTDSDYPFGIFKLFCQMIISSIKMNCSLVHSRQLILYVKLHLNQIKGCTHSCRQIRQQQVYFWHL